MASLFEGVENFTPAFTGQELAIKAGAGAAQAFTSGVNAGTGMKNAETRQFEAGMEDDSDKDKGNDETGMGGFMGWLKGIFGGGKK